MTWFLTMILMTMPIHAGSDKTSCTTRELKRLDCRLSSGGHKMRLLPESIARDDGIWHTVDEMPLKGDWEKMHFEKMNGRPILQMWIWDQGSGETKVQSLHWYVTEVGKAKMQILAEGIVRRRHLRGEKPGDFIYDGFEKHELKAGKQGNLEWKLGSQSKTLGPVPETPAHVEDPKDKKGEHDAH